MVAESFHIPYVISVLVLLIAVLVWDRFKASTVFLGAMGLLIIGGVLPVSDFVSGLSNRSILTIFLLIGLTAAINDQLNLAAFFDRFFSKNLSTPGFLLKMGSSVALISSVMNNTPVVAMMMPYVYRWGRNNKVNPSHLLIPLSYAAILGGVITLIGTSTNLVLNGLIEQHGGPLLQFFDFLVPGVSVTVVCLLFLAYLTVPLLRKKKDFLKELEDNRREYVVELMVSEGSALANKTIEAAGLRNLEEVFLVEIIREEEVIAAVGPEDVIYENDTLLFAGETDKIFDLIQPGRGLELRKKSEFGLTQSTETVEAVVAYNSSLDHKSAKEVDFREMFDAAIIGIHRRGSRVNGKLGSVSLMAGDLLLLSAGNDFRNRNGRLQDLIVINSIKEKTPFSSQKKVGFIAGLVVFIGLAIAGYIGLFEALLGVAAVQMAAGMLNLETLKRSVSFDLLVILISSLALGEALISSGAADYLTEVLFGDISAKAPMAIYASIFFTAFVLTSFVTNVAAITIIYPVIAGLASGGMLDPQALYLTAAFGASCCFVTPFAYQTNLMVLEAGNYTFKDFVKVGLPLSFLYALVFLSYIYFVYL